MILKYDVYTLPNGKITLKKKVKALEHLHDSRKREDCKLNSIHFIINGIAVHHIIIHEIVGVPGRTLPSPCPTRNLCYVSHPGWGVGGRRAVRRCTANNYTTQYHAQGSEETSFPLGTTIINCFFATQIRTGAARSRFVDSCRSFGQLLYYFWQ